VTDNTVTDNTVTDNTGIGHAAQSITVEGVTKEYAGSSVALQDVSLQVEPGEFVVLLGPSGSGKTTLLRCLAGIERLTAGQISIAGKTVASDQVHVPPDRRNLSMVFQDYALWPHLRVRENVAFALRRSRLPKPDARARTHEMLERVGLARLAERYPNELSGGEQQRVALARALVGGTGLILCDEPLSNLDADLRERMRVEISSLVRESGATAVYITHDQAEAFALADRIGLLQSGRLIQFGRPEEIYTRPSSPFVARFTGLSGELPVRVANAAVNGDGTVRVDADGSVLVRPCRARLSGTGWSGGDALLLIRPTGAQICGADSADSHLTGTVADVAFRGRGYEHAIDIGASPLARAGTVGTRGGVRLTGVFAPVRAERGDIVSLRLDPAGCHVFPAEPSAAASAATDSAEPDQPTAVPA
jgi:iron(III) transport system ATP-binding protein